MTPIAFATCDAFPHLSDDDRPVADLLRGRGVEVVPAVWDDPAVEWSRFRHVVIRSTWDYHLKADAYQAWLRARAAEGDILHNSADVVLANIDKRYLLDLERDGVAIVASDYLPAGTHDLADILRRRGWAEAVVKPAVSAGAHGTWRTSAAAAAADQARFAGQGGACDVLVQEYAAEVATEGEWSLVFLGGRYSHGVLKRPARGDFRVQQHLGGDTFSAEPPRGLVEQAEAILTRVPSPLLYARVDGVNRGGRLVLMELEVNEPYLFLGNALGAAERFARAILSACGG